MINTFDDICLRQIDITFLYCLVVKLKIIFMQQITSIVIIVGIIGLGLYGKSNSGNSSQIVPEDSSSQIVPTEVKTPEEEMKSVKNNQVVKGPSIPKSSVNPRQEIQDGYDRMATSFIQKDSNVYLDYLTPSFISIGIRGHKANLKQVRKNHAILFKETEFVQAKMAIQKFNLNNHAGTVSVLVNKNVNMLMHNHKIVSETTTQDLWVKNKSGWQLKQSRDLSNRIALDGIKMSAN